MRFTLAILFVFPTLASAQTEKIEQEIRQKLAAIKFVQLLQDGKGGFAGGPKDLKPSLKSTSAAVRALKYLTGKKTLEAVPNAKLHADYVLSCFDPKTGGFADVPGGKPDVYVTAVGVMAAVELEIPKEKFAKSLEYLKANAKSFEDVRIGAAAVEAWGVKDCPFKLEPWQEIANKGLGTKLPKIDEGGARLIASITAFTLRLGLQKDTDSKPAEIARVINLGQRDDGGWSREGEKASDLETTYRVMRAFHLLKGKPGNAVRLRAFIDKCRNPDGGFGVKPGDPSTVGGTYFATIITKWLDDME